MIYYLFNTLAYAKSIYSRPQNSLIPRLAKKYKISEMKKYHNLFPAPTAKKCLLTLRRSCSKKTNKFELLKGTSYGSFTRGFTVSG